MEQIKKDFDETLPKCVRMTKESVEALPALHKFCGKAMRLIAPFDVMGERRRKTGLAGKEPDGIIQKKKRKRAEENFLYSLPSFSFSWSAAAVLMDDSARSRKEVAPISFCRLRSRPQSVL